jgi:hypothetical protein
MDCREPGNFRDASGFGATAEWKPRDRRRFGLSVENSEPARDKKEARSAVHTPGLRHITFEGYALLTLNSTAAEISARN